MSRHYQSRTGLTVEEIYVLSNRLQVNQVQAGNQILEQLGEQSGLLTSIANTQLVLRELLLSSHEQARSELAPYGAEPSHPIIGLKVRTPKHERYPCTAFCVCNCHEPRQFVSPHSVYNIIGALFSGYSGYPREAFRRCNKSNCRGQQVFKTSIVYTFPLWFLNKALSATLIAGLQNEIQVSLRVTRIVSSTSESFRMIWKNDVDGLKRLFTQRLASPNDVLPNGQTALLVRQLSSHTAVIS